MHARTTDVRRQRSVLGICHLGIVTTVYELCFPTTRYSAAVAFIPIFYAACALDPICA
jgi:hypothetical protein